MTINKFLSTYGISLACVLSVISTGAYAATNSFSFTVPLQAGATGKDGCSTAVSTDAHGCAILTERALVNGNCQATSNVQTVCPGEQGDSCAIESVTQTASGRDIKFNCGGTTTTVPVENGTSCTMSLNKNATTGDVTVSKQCANESNPTTITIETSDIADEAVNKITAAGTFATNSQLTDLNNKLPTLDASTGAMTWTDPNGISSSYGHYTFWYSGTYNKKINNKWFKCNRYYTDAPTTSYVQNQVENMYCSSVEGWTYGTDCLLDGGITAYDEAVPGNGVFPNWKFKVCWEIKSGDITTLIDEQVTAKGYATQGALANYYTQTQVDEITTTLNAKITSAAAGVSDEHLAELIAGVVGDDYPTTSEMNTAITNATKLSALTATLGDTYLTPSNASSTYLNKTDAGSTYLSKTDASGTYLTKSDAGSTYATKTAVSALENTVASLPDEERVAQLAAQAASAAAYCNGTVDVLPEDKGTYTQYNVVCDESDN